jgi:broad-specificity NMP kinase
MMCDWKSPALTLVDLGGHSLIPDSDCTNVRKALEATNDAPEQFWPQIQESFFVRLTSKEWRTFGTELFADWIYYLDEEQCHITESIYEDSIPILLGEGYYRVHVLLGGPGTGKTCILLNLLKRFYEEGGFDVGLVIAEEVGQYIQSSTSIDVNRFRCEFPLQSKLDVLLIDDPSSTQTLRQIGDCGNSGSAKVIVLAFDPLQLDEPLSDEGYEEFEAQHNAVRHVLHTCYRQKEHVGKATKRIVDSIAKSTPFLADEKQQKHWNEHRVLTELSNGLRFVNPYGYANLYEQATASNLRFEIDELKRQPGGLWSHYTPLLVAVIHESLVWPPDEWLKILDRSGVDYRTVAAIDLRLVKGVEFQHVFVIVSAKICRQLNEGFQGSGRRTYDQRRLLRIPFSRAKDRLVIFTL